MSAEPFSQLIDVLLSSEKDASDRLSLLESNFEKFEQKLKSCMAAIECLERDKVGENTLQSREMRLSFQKGTRNEESVLAHEESAISSQVKEQASNLEATFHHSDTSVIADIADYCLQQTVWDAAVFMRLELLGATTWSVLGILFMANFLLQTSFCCITALFMVEEPIDDEVLIELLRWRIDAGHNVAYMDPNSFESLTSQLCRGSTNHVVASTQVALYQDISAFITGGAYLSPLAMCCWIIVIWTELLNIWKFCSAIQALQADMTVITLLEHQTTIQSLSKHSVLMMYVFVIFPRFCVAVLLACVGVLYLAATTVVGDLLLNAMALAFVLSLDELLFAAFIPTKVDSLLNKTKPIVHNFVRIRCSGIENIKPFFGVIFVPAVLVLIHAMLVAPSLKLMEDGATILCSEMQDFVYTVDGTTRLVVAAQSFPHYYVWSPQEEAVLEFTGLVEPGLASSFLIDTLIDTRPNASWSTKLPKDDDNKEWEDTEPSAGYLNILLVWSTASPEDRSERVACADARADILNAQLPQVTDEEYVSCSESKDMCSNISAVGVRTLCPTTCECHVPRLSRSGFFQTNNFGCPTSCQIFNDLMMSSELAPCFDQILDNATQDSSIWRKFVSGIYSFLKDEASQGWETYVKEVVNNYYEEFGFDVGFDPSEKDDVVLKIKRFITQGFFF